MGYNGRYYFRRNEFQRTLWVLINRASPSIVWNRFYVCSTVPLPMYCKMSCSINMSISSQHRSVAYGDEQKKKRKKALPQ